MATALSSYFGIFARLGSTDFSFIFNLGLGGLGPDLSRCISPQRRRPLHRQPQLLRRHGPEGELRTSPLQPDPEALFLGIGRTYLFMHCFHVAIFINAMETWYIGQAKAMSSTLSSIQHIYPALAFTFCSSFLFELLARNTFNMFVWEECRHRSATQVCRSYGGFRMYGRGQQVGNLREEWMATLGRRYRVADRG